VEGFFLVIAAVIVYALVAGWDGGTRYRPQRLRRAVWTRPAATGRNLVVSLWNPRDSC
jgi:hypothetical protein